MNEIRDKVISKVLNFKTNQINRDIFSCFLKNPVNLEILDDFSIVIKN